MKSTSSLSLLAFILASLVSASLQVANQWDKAVVLRMGRFQALRGPGLFFIIPVVDSIVYWIDTRKWCGAHCPALEATSER